MATTDFQTVMLPLLALGKDEQEHSNSEAIDALAGVLALTEAERKELLPSGQQAVFDNRVAWARTHMKMAGLFESTQRHFYHHIEFYEGCTCVCGQLESKIVLLDGEQLAQLMVEHSVGVTAVANYEVKKIDSDYFAEN